MSENRANHFSAEYVARLQASYPANIVADITEDWRYADLASPAGERIPYVRVNQGVGRPVFYVNGFTEGIVAKAPFAAELAKLEHDVILPDQNRKKIMKDTMTGRKDATYTQAQNYLAVLAAEDLLHSGPVDFVTHSYGSLIFESMFRIGQEYGYRAFKESRVVMLAPAGFNDRETVPSLLRRFVQMVRSEDKAPKQYGEFGGEMLQAGMKNATANIGRVAREGWHLARRQVDPHKFFDGGIESLTIATYGEDPLYSDEVVYSGVSRAVARGASWLVPVALEMHGTKGIEGASHNDEQFNPPRVARVVSHLLQQTS